MTQKPLIKDLSIKNKTPYLLYIDILEDDPRSTPGHLKVLDQIRSIMKYLIVASTVGLTKRLTKNFDIFYFSAP